MPRTLPAPFLAALLLPALALGAGSPVAPYPPGGNGPGRDGLHIEVVNRSGIPGLGHKTARFLRDQGYAVAALDDTLRYDRDSTYLFYSEGSSPKAVALARLIPGEQEVGKAPYPLPPGIQLRLVIGADLARRLP